VRAITTIPQREWGDFSVGETFLDRHEREILAALDVSVGL
jgi:hypothetical protein